MDEIIEIIQKSCIEIYQELGKTIPNDSYIIGKNESGDIQKPLDIITNNIICNNLSKVPSIAGILSEEQDEYLKYNESGSYIVSFDPLDGSGNSVLNLSTGSIFAIFKATCLEEVSGRNIVGALYSINGPTLEIITVNSKIKIRTLYINDNNELKPIIINNNIKIPYKGSIYVANEGNYNRWSEKLKSYIKTLKGRSLRWMACCVADVHRLLIEGGVYMYPSDTKQTNGKLRLVYEVYPLAYIWERCGGISLDENNQSCLDIPFQSDNIHLRTPVFLLGQYEYEEWLKIHKQDLY